VITDFIKYITSIKVNYLQNVNQHEDVATPYLLAFGLMAVNE